MSALQVLANIAGGAALLLWAARMVHTGMERAFGASLRRTLSHALRGRLRAVGAGLGVTLVLQSATATALLALALTPGSIMPLSSGLALMLGADVGSAVVVSVLASGIASLAPLFLLLGVVLFLATSARRSKQIGRVLIGLGLLFLSLQLIGTAAQALRESATLPAVLAPLAGEPLLALLVAALLTWAVHSSVATVLFFASLAGAGVLELPLALALVLGANAGAGLVPVTLTLARTSAERRIPIGNLLMRCSGALVGLLLLAPIARQVGTLIADPALQVVTFHLLLNAALVVVFAPLTGFAAALAERLVVDRGEPQARLTPADNPSNLDPAVIDKPALAIAAATRELLRVADWVEVMLRRSFEIFETGDKNALALVAEIDDQIDRRTASIKHYLIQVTRNELDTDDSQRCMEIVSFAVKLEHVGDIVEKNLLQLVRKHRQSGTRFSPAGWAELSELHERVIANLQLAINTFVSSDVQSARQLLAERERFRRLEAASSRKHLGRLRTGTAESIDSTAIHLDVVRDLVQINSLVVSAAVPALERSPGTQERTTGDETPSPPAPDDAGEPLGRADRAARSGPG